MTKTVKNTMSIQEIGGLCIGKLDLEGIDVNRFVGLMDDISNLCTIKSGNATDEIAEIEEKAGITLSNDQKKKVTAKYETAIDVPEGNEKAVSMVGIQARQIKRFIQVVSE